jgi:hypothetical protein
MLAYPRQMWRAAPIEEQERGRAQLPRVRRDPVTKGVRCLVSQAATGAGKTRFAAAIISAGAEMRVGSRLFAGSLRCANLGAIEGGPDTSLASSIRRF